MLGLADDPEDLPDVGVAAFSRPLVNCCNRDRLVSLGLWELEAEAPAEVTGGV